MNPRLTIVRKRAVSSQTLVVGRGAARVGASRGVTVVIVGRRGTRVVVIIIITGTGAKDETLLEVALSIVVGTLYKVTDALCGVCVGVSATLATVTRHALVGLSGVVGHRHVERVSSGDEKEDEGGIWMT